MKHISLFVLLLVSVAGVGQTTYTATGGSWTNAGTWDNGVPTSGSSAGNENVIVIPPGVTVSMPALSTITLTHVVLYVQGTLDFGILTVNALEIYGAGSGVFVQTGGQITSFLSLGYLYVDNTGDLWWPFFGSPATLNGPITMGAPNDPLPVTLIDWHVRADKGSLWATWSTASELNNDYFTIEESADGFDFWPVAQIEGAGTTFQQQNYSYAFSPLNQQADVLYYRLKQTDYDGSYAYSHIVSVDRGYFEFKAERMEVFPNPVREGQFYITNPNRVVRQVKVMDLSGREVLNEVYNGGNSSSRLPLTMPKVAPGMYQVVLIGDKGIESKKIYVAN